MNTRTTVFALTILLPSGNAAPTLAADLCQAVAASGSARYLLAEKSGGIVEMAKPAAFPADVKDFVVKLDETFQDQVFEIYPLGKSGAGFAVHYEGTLAEQYSFAFDRVGGKLKAVEVPNLNPGAKDYRETKIAIIAGTPALFGNDTEDGKAVIRIAPWLGHAWGPVCELKSAAEK